MSYSIDNKKYIKLHDLPNNKIKQLRYEIETWKRTLEFLTEENIFLKIRLSEILKDKFNHNLLEEFEQFQTQFLKEDETVSFLRNEVAEFDTLLTKEIFQHKDIRQGIEIKSNQLRANIINAEIAFCNLNVDFNSYLLENM